MLQRHPTDVIVVTTSAGLVLAPVALTVLALRGDDTFPAVWHFVTAGLAGFGLGIRAVLPVNGSDLRCRLRLEAAVGGLGVWLLLSPWALGFTYSVSASVVAIVCGLLLAGCSASAVAATAKTLVRRQPRPPLPRTFGDDDVAAEAAEVRRRGIPVLRRAHIILEAMRWKTEPGGSGGLSSSS